MSAGMKPMILLASTATIYLSKKMRVKHQEDTKHLDDLCLRMAKQPHSADFLLLGNMCAQIAERCYKKNLPEMAEAWDNVASVWTGIFGADQISQMVYNKEVPFEEIEKEEEELSMEIN